MHELHDPEQLRYSGLSPAAAHRLGQLEAKPEREPMERGELRSMLHSRPNGPERARIERLLASAPSPPGETTPPGDAISPGEAARRGEAYQRGLQRGKESNRQTYGR